jgi:hypothetical protein
MELVQDLAGGGETSDNLIVYLFESYLQVTDETFKRYIERKKEVYDEGSEDIMVGTLMDLALVKYNQLSQAGELNHSGTTENAEQKQVFALIAELKEAITGKGSKHTQNKNKGKGQDQKNHKSKGTRNNSGKGKGNGERKRLPEWRYQRDGNKTTLVKDGKTWRWCDHHAYWCEHVTSECRAKKKSDSTKTDGQTTKTKKVRFQDDEQTSDNSLSIARALLAYADGDEPHDETDL